MRTDGHACLAECCCGAVVSNQHTHNVCPRLLTREAACVCRRTGRRRRDALWRHRVGQRRRRRRHVRAARLRAQEAVRVRGQLPGGVQGGARLRVRA